MSGIKGLRYMITALRIRVPEFDAMVSGDGLEWKNKGGGNIFALLGSEGRMQATHDELTKGQREIGRSVKSGSFVNGDGLNVGSVSDVDMEFGGNFGARS